MTTSSNNDLNNTINTICVEIEKFLNWNAQSQAHESTKTRVVPSASNSDVLQLVKTKQDSDRLKQILRTSNWSPMHPIRKSLWPSLLNPINKSNHTNSSNKENNISNKNPDETEYSSYLNQIFGKSKPFRNLN